MISELSIKNFAIIDDLTVTFKKGLTVLSGETGAGKSIIINAVNLILGSRASSKLIRTGEETAEIEALFEIDENSPAGRLLRIKNLYSGDGLLIRRLISKNDRHKIFINGNMATIQMLSEITDNLASIAGQHAHQGLLKEDQHLILLDQFGGLGRQRGLFSQKFNEFIPLIKKYRIAKSSAKNQSDQIELLEFQKSEIEKAALMPGEDGELESERKRLKNSQLLFRTSQECQQALYQMDGSVSERVYDLKGRLEKAADIDTDLLPSLEELNDIAFRIEDLAGTLREYEKNIETDSGRLESVEERIDFINRLKRKYGQESGSLEDIDRHYNDICSKLSEVKNLSGDLEETEKELTKLHEELSIMAQDLSAKRKKAAENFSQKVEQELADLEMSGTSFSVQLSDLKADQNSDLWLHADNRLLTESGSDRASFMISPNIGEELKPLNKIASGGELSRIILALKAILARNESVATIVFDEVDTGIGGGTAEVVGKKIKELADIHQILCITHLPQIAKFADHHYSIEKNVTNGRTCTTINRLDDQNRISELARMLGGIELTDATLNHAKEMIEKIN